LESAVFLNKGNMILGLTH